MDKEAKAKAKQDYNAREKRMNDAIALRVPDRVPIAVSHVLYYFTKIKGMTNKDAMLDHEKRLQIWKDVTMDLNLDVCIHPIVLPPAQPFSLLGMKQFKWPGQDLADDASFQYVENEYLKANEYDDFLKNPGDFTVRMLWPRLAEEAMPLAMLPPLQWFSNGRDLGFMLAPLLGLEPFQEMLEKVVELGRVSQNFMMLMLDYIDEMKNLGYPLGYGSSAVAPFDYIADQLRGMKGIMLDMFRQPDKILKATEYFTEEMLDSARFLGNVTGNKRVWMPLHRGSAEFMSEAQFEKFYWPSLKKLIEDLVDEGMTPVTYFEGEYTPRLKYLAELPKGKILAHFDRVDRKEAKKMIGDTMVFWGNVPARLLITGTPDQVKDDVKDLIDTFADNGGLIVDSSMGIPDQAKPENVEAMVETVFTYGKS